MTDTATVALPPSPQIDVVGMARAVARNANVVNALTIDSAEMYEQAGIQLKRISEAAKQFDDQRKAIVTPINDSVKRINDLFRPTLEGLEAMRVKLKAAMTVWSDAEEARVAEERRVAEAQAEAERKRIEAEAREQAAALRAAGDDSGADEVVEQAAAEVNVISVPVVKAETPKVSGVSTRMVWTFEITDMKALMAEIVAGTNPLATEALVEACSKVIRQRVTAMRSDFKVAGIRVYQTKQIAG